MITIDKLTKKFGNHFGVRGVETVVPSGCIYGLVGSNGSGKSTLLRLVSGIYHPEKGQVLLDGQPVFEHPETKERIFYISDDQYTDRNSCILDMARMYAQIYPGYDVQMALDLTKQFKLDAKARFKTFSKGMKRQAHIILGLAAKPAVLLCDETFDGLDPVKRRAVKKAFSELMLSEGATIIIASHNLRELEDICDVIGLMHDGKFVFQRALDDLELDFYKLQTAFTMVRRREDFAALSPLSFEQRGRMISMIVRGKEDEILQAINAMKPLYAEVLPLSLEEIFITEMEVLGYDTNDILQ
ncbi:MAG: ABC transporter ATP-binding protein [Peptococcaceae bacterium]|nr:ABC transporter ATP-binding protein [Peptococcaceae bacterium]